MPEKYVDIKQQHCRLKSNIPAEPVCSWWKLKQMDVWALPLLLPHNITLHVDYFGIEIILCGDCFCVEIIFAWKLSFSSPPQYYSASGLFWHAFFPFKTDIRAMVNQIDPTEKNVAKNVMNMISWEVLTLIDGLLKHLIMSEQCWFLFKICTESWRWSYLLFDKGWC